MTREFDTWELVQRCARRQDADLWEQFLERFKGPLRGGVQRALLRYDARVTDDDRQDLMQEVYCRLLDKRRRSLRRCRGRDDAEISSYLGRVAESVVIDQLRSWSAAKRGRRLLRELPRDSSLDSVADGVDCRRTPEEQLLLRERRTRFMTRCREAIGDDRRERNLRVIYLAFFEGWTSREISERLGEGLTPSSIDSLVHRLKSRLSQSGLKIPRREPGGALVD